MTVPSRAFRLGDWSFSLQSRNLSLLDTLQSILPAYDFPQAKSGNHQDLNHYETTTVVDLDQPCRFLDDSMVTLSTLSPLYTVVFVIDEALRHNTGRLWFDASCMIDSKGRAILIAGASATGKTTLSLSMCYVLGWKIVAEDITFIDQESMMVLPFNRPLSLREGAVDLINSACEFFGCKTRVGPQSCAEWFFDGELFWRQKVKADFNLAVILETAMPDEKRPLAVEEVSASDYIRRVLSISNTIRLDEGLNIVAEALKKSRCFSIRGGELSERIEFMRGVC